MSHRTRRIRKHRAAVRRANHLAVSKFGPREWVGDAYTSRCIYGEAWMRDYAPQSPRLRRVGFVLCSVPRDNHEIIHVRPLGYPKAFDVDRLRKREAMKLCENCQGWGRWGQDEAQRGAPPMPRGVCGIECGTCRGRCAENLGVVEVEDQDALERWIDLVEAERDVDTIAAALVAAGQRLRDARAACGDEPAEQMAKRLGVPPELIERAHWARARAR